MLRNHIRREFSAFYDTANWYLADLVEQKHKTENNTLKFNIAGKIDGYNQCRVVVEQLERKIEEILNEEGHIEDKGIVNLWMQLGQSILNESRRKDSNA